MMVQPGVAEVFRGKVPQPVQRVGRGELPRGDLGEQALERGRGSRHRAAGSR